MANTKITSANLDTLTTLTVDDITIDGSTISDSGDLTLDVAGTISLDADGADIMFKDGGTEFGRVYNSSSDFAIYSAVQDKDIKLQGNDGGSAITALTLDMSDAGSAYFNNRVGIGTNNPDTKLHVFKATAGSITDYSNNALIVENSGDVGISFHTPNANAGHLMFGSPGHQYHSYIRGQYGASTTSTLKFFTDQINTMTHKAGKVGIGTASPSSLLHMESGNAHNKLSITSTANGGTGYDAVIDLLGSASNSEVQLNMGINGDADREQIKTYQSAMSFRTNNSERMRLNSSGQLGIACTDQSNLLTVDANSASTTTDSISVRNRGVTSVNHTAGLRFQFNSAVSAAIRTRLTNTSSGAGTLSFYTSTDGTAGNLTERTTISSSGNVGVNFVSPNHKLEVNEGAFGVTYPISINNHLAGFNGRGSGIKFKSNTTEQCRIFYYHYGTIPTLFYDGDMHRFRNVASATLLDIGSTGNASLTGSLTQNASDERLKNEITEIPNAIDKIKELKGVSFKWKGNGAKDFPHEDGKKDIGVIAQDVQKVLPEAVEAAPFDLEKDMEENSDGSFTEKITSKSGKDYLTVHSEKLIPVLIQGIKEQQDIIDDLKARIETLEG